jgi:hypothetical protein
MTGYVDGNALAGPLSDIFAVDVTAAVGQCARCGRSGSVASLRLYGVAQGRVARCPGCDAVLLRLVQGRDAVWLDLRGMVFLQIPVPQAATAPPATAVPG